MSDIQTRKLDEILSRLAQMEVTLGVVASESAYFGRVFGPFHERRGRLNTADKVHAPAPPA
jgi:hypothetical protein